MWRNYAVILGSALGVMWASGTAGAEDTEAMSIERLRCEYRENPLGIDARVPRLSWVLSCPRRGAQQTAFQVLVASTPENLQQDRGDRWDSGKVLSGQSIQVPFGGTPLASRQSCYWKVRVWDEADQVTPWSAPASWTMGLLEPADWQGQYIGHDAQQGNPEFPWLRKTFSLAGQPAEGRVYVNALGYYELYVNGRKVDDHVLSPAVSQFSKRSFYITHDVRPYLTEGTNCIALWLGRGWYAQGLPGVVYDGPLVRAQLEVTDANGALTRVCTDNTWKAHPSPFARIGTWHSGKYGGERYDAREEMPGWSEADFDDSAWPNAIAIDVPEHTVCAQPAEPNRLQRRFEPAVVRFFDKDTWLLDFGTNLSGYFEINFTGLAPGQRIGLEYGDRVEGEELDSFSQRDQYVARGDAHEQFRNRFNYHAFRYVKVQGLTAPPDTGDAAAYLIHTDYPQYASFACSNPVLTRVHDMIGYTLRCLSLGGYLVDCPHIERLGYGGDGQASTQTALTLFGLGPMYTGWLGHWRDCQQPDGGMPHTAPCPYPAGGGPYWCGFIIAASWRLFEQYGDRRVLEDNYPAMQLWLGYVESYCKDGLLEPWPETEYRSWYLGDWATPTRREEKEDPSRHLVNNCFRIQCYDWMARIARELGREDDAARYHAQAETLRPQVHQAFYDTEHKTYVGDCQLALAYPLLAGVTPEDLRADVLQRLEHDILVKHEGHLDVGLVGVPILVEQLMAADRNDLVHTIAAQETFPGWGYMLANGATTTWEHWDAKRSHIHNCYNGIGVWFYRGLAGIRPDDAAPGFKHFILRPALLNGLTWVKARQDTVHGPIESAWRIEDGRFLWDLAIPANTTATVMVPADDAKTVMESKDPAAQAEGLRFVRTDGPYAVFEAVAGRYAFSAPPKVPLRRGM